VTYLGIDLGTSAVKALLVDDAQRALAVASAPLTVSRPKPLWSEQDPDAWVQATFATFEALRREQPAAFAAVGGIGLSGQMHGAVLLDSLDRPLRPAILWNDGRSGAECAALEAAWPALRQVTGNLAMPGFTAPKLLWVARHEPDVFHGTARVLLPKAYLRLVLTGDAIEDCSDASGTLWLDVGGREWSDAALAATHLTREKMPVVVEGTAPAGRMRPELALRFGFTTPPLFAGGAGDNAAGAIGLGAIAPGDAFVSLGTSGVIFAVTDRFAPNPDDAVHAFCHALPGRWHQMAVMLSAASCLAWWSGATAMTAATLLAEMGTPQGPTSELFAPYLSGERTPHNDPVVRGGFTHIGHETTRAGMTQAVLEGVAFAFKDGLDALARAGTHIEAADVIGGGSRSAAWIDIFAQVLNLRLHRLADGEVGGAFGAARLARLAVSGEAPEAMCTKPARIETITPDPTRVGAYAVQHTRWRRLHPAFRDLAA
jgi:xylulokinase